MKDKIIKSLQENVEVKSNLLKNHVDTIEKIAQKIIYALKKGKKIVIFGNGGSATDSQHMAAELIGRFKKDRRSLPAIALTENIATITSITNDYDYSLVFLRQIEALANKGDVAIGISTSGNSSNVIKAIEKAKEKGLIIIGLTGEEGGTLKEVCQLTLRVPSHDTARIQEAHITLIHIFCDLVEENLFKD